jgi:hypothetical protein
MLVGLQLLARNAEERLENQLLMKFESLSLTHLMSSPKQRTTRVRKIVKMHQQEAWCVPLASSQLSSPRKARPIIAIAKKQRGGGSAAPQTAVRDKSGQSVMQPASPSRQPGASPREKTT